MPRGKPTSEVADLPGFGTVTLEGPPLVEEDPSQMPILKAAAEIFAAELTTESERRLAEEMAKEAAHEFIDDSHIQSVRAVNGPRGLHAKLAEVILEVEYIQKTGTAPAVMGGYKFVEAGQIAARLRKALATRGVTMLPEHIEQVGKVIKATTKSGGILFIQTILTRWRLTDSETGETTTIESMGTGGDSGDKFSPKAQTNAMKYAFQVGFLLETGDDPEKFDLTGAPAEGPGITITGSNVKGVKPGGRQGMATEAQLNEIRTRARDLALEPPPMALLIGANLGGKAPDIDSLELRSDQQSAILKFLGELSFEECAKVVQALIDVGGD